MVKTHEFPNVRSIHFVVLNFQDSSFENSHLFVIRNLPFETLN